MLLFSPCHPTLGASYLSLRDLTLASLCSHHNLSPCPPFPPLFLYPVSTSSVSAPLASLNHQIQPTPGPRSILFLDATWFSFVFSLIYVKWRLSETSSVLKTIVPFSYSMLIPTLSPLIYFYL